MSLKIYFINKNMQKSFFPHILLIDDDDKIRSLVSEFLKEKNFYISLSNNTKNARKLINFYNFDLLLIDIMMPKEDGVTFLENFRKQDVGTPVLMLTAVKEIDKKVKSFVTGCDDYLVKPFEPQELVVRIKKLLNPRIANLEKNKIVFGEYEYDHNFEELRKDNTIIKLTNIEHSILKIFCSNLNKTLSRDFLAEKLGIRKNYRSIDVVITRLRKKIINNDNSSFLRTIRGSGYMLRNEYKN